MDQPKMNAKVFVPVYVPELGRTYNVKTYYRVHCHVKKCLAQLDGSYRKGLAELIERAHREEWTHDTDGNFYCSEHRPALLENDAQMVLWSKSDEGEEAQYVPKRR